MNTYIEEFDRVRIGSRVVEDEKVKADRYLNGLKVLFKMK